MTKGYGKHPVGGRVWKNNKCDHITHGEEAGEKTCLYGATNKSAQNGISLAETSSQTGEDDHQHGW